ncbi:MAG: DUF3047 domain-containing protein [Granulosicoccus sp.]
MNRQNSTTIASACLLLCVTLPHTQAAPPVSVQPISNFTDANLDNWSERSFEGNTRYELVEENGFRLLKAHTESQASILYREQTIDLNKTPIITWDWKIDRTFQNIDEKARGGDDFPARLYVAAKTGFLPWQTVAINYVWASQVPVGETWPNPFSAKAKMVAVQSGDTHSGKWTRHTRDVAADFKTLFNLDIQEINGYAVMVDGDNAQKEATAWFGEITFSAAAPAQ